MLLVADEVICGFGRLGRWFGHQHFGLQPDLVTMAKGLSSGYLPISATVVSHEIIELLREKDSEFFHGFTYSGHPTCAAVALRNIEIIEREGLVQRTAEVTGPYLNQALQRLRAHPLVGEVRSLGLIGAVEIVRQKGTNLRFGDKEGTAGPIVRDRCIANGLMVRAVRDTIDHVPATGDHAGRDRPAGRDPRKIADRGGTAARLNSVRAAARSSRGLCRQRRPVRPDLKDRGLDCPGARVSRADTRRSPADHDCSFARKPATA